MSEFSSITRSFTVRGREVKIREWTVGERFQFLMLRREDKLKALNFMVSVCLVDPVYNPEQVAEELPAKVYDTILEAVLDINEEKKTPVDLEAEAALDAELQVPEGEVKNG